MQHTQLCLSIIQKAFIFIIIISLRTQHAASSTCLTNDAFMLKSGIFDPTLCYSPSCPLATPMINSTFIDKKCVPCKPGFLFQTIHHVCYATALTHSPSTKPTAMIDCSNHGKISYSSTNVPSCICDKGFYTVLQDIYNTTFCSSSTPPIPQKKEVVGKQVSDDNVNNSMGDTTIIISGVFLLLVIIIGFFIKRFLFKKELRITDNANKAKKAKKRKRRKKLSKDKVIETGNKDPKTDPKTDDHRINITEKMSDSTIYVAKEMDSTAANICEITRSSLPKTNYAIENQSKSHNTVIRLREDAYRDFIANRLSHFQNQGI